MRRGHTSTVPQVDHASQQMQASKKRNAPHLPRNHHSKCTYWGRRIKTCFWDFISMHNKYNNDCDGDGDECHDIWTLISLCIDVAIVAIASGRHVIWKTSEVELNRASNYKQRQSTTAKTAWRWPRHGSCRLTSFSATTTIEANTTITSDRSYSYKRTTKQRQEQ
jgi:hypothetical protein